MKGPLSLQFSSWCLFRTMFAWLLASSGHAKVLNWEAHLCTIGSTNVSSVFSIQLILIFLIHHFYCPRVKQDMVVLSIWCRHVIVIDSHLASYDEWGEVAKTPLAPGRLVRLTAGARRLSWRLRSTRRSGHSLAVLVYTHIISKARKSALFPFLYRQ